MAAGDSPLSSRTAVLRVPLEGRLDALRALSLRAQFDGVVDEALSGTARSVLVDLSEVVFVDSAALAALVRLRRLCEDARLELTFVKPRHEDALRIFRLTQFDQVFTMVDADPDR